MSKFFQQFVVRFFPIILLWLFYDFLVRRENRRQEKEFFKRGFGTTSPKMTAKTPASPGNKNPPGQYSGEVLGAPGYTNFTENEIDPDGTLRRLPGGPAMLDGVAAEFERIRANFDPPQPFTVNSRIVTADRRLRFSLKVTPPVTAWQGAFNKLTTQYLNERPSVLSPVFGTDDGLVVETNPTRFT